MDAKPPGVFTLPPGGFVRAELPASCQTEPNHAWSIRPPQAGGKNGKRRASASPDQRGAPM